VLVARVLNHRLCLGAVTDVSIAAVVTLVDGGAVLVGLVPRCRAVGDVWVLLHLWRVLILKLRVLLLQILVALHIQI